MKNQAPLTAVVARLTLALIVTSASIVNGAIVAQYHFDESGGGTAFDSAGSFNGSLSAAGASFVPGGISGNAISLDEGLGGLVNMGTAFPGFTSGDFSLVMWLKTTTLDDTLPLGKHESGTSNGYFIAINQTGGGGAPGKAIFYVSEAPSQSPASVSSVNDGAWHQIVGVYQASGMHSIYVDGLPVESTSVSQSVGGNGAAFLVGGINVGGAPAATYTGLIDEVQVYDHALNDSEIGALFQNPQQVVPEPGTLTLLCAGLFGWMAFRRRSSGS